MPNNSTKPLSELITATLDSQPEIAPEAALLIALASRNERIAELERQLAEARVSMAELAAALQVKSSVPPVSERRRKWKFQPIENWPPTSNPEDVYLVQEYWGSWEVAHHHSTLCTQWRNWMLLPDELRAE